MIAFNHETPTPIHRMTPARLKTLIATAVALDREIATKTDELKALKGELLQEALSRPDERNATDGGGWTWTFEGADGCIVRVTAPAPSLKSRIDGEAKGFDKIKDAAGRFFDRLFRPSVSYRLADNFRAEAEELLQRGAGKLIRLCESASPPKVSFETKDPAA